MLERKLGSVERLFGALAFGVVVAGGASPAWAVATPALAAVACSTSCDSITPRVRDAVTLTALGLFAALFGIASALALALAWRVCVEVRAGELRAASSSRRDAAVTSALQIWSAPLAALLWRVEAPLWAQLTAVGVAALVLADWGIRRLAEWRLGDLQPHTAAQFAMRQALVVAPLALLPTVPAALAALCFAKLLRKARLPAIPATA